MARKNTGDPILDLLAKKKNMTGYELRSQRSTPKKASEPTGNVTPRRGKKAEGPDKDYSDKRNIWNQRKSKVTTRESSTDRQGKVTEKKITTKTRSISPRRTVVTTAGDVTSPKGKKPYNPILRPGAKATQEGKAKTIRTKRLGKFLAKNPEYKVGDRVLKTKVKEEVKKYKPGQSNAPQTYTTRSSKKGRVAAAREYQAKSIPRKIVQGLPHAFTGYFFYKGKYFKHSGGYTGQ